MKKSKAKKNSNAKKVSRKAAVVEASSDADRCATVGCQGTAVITHLGRPRCQACWNDEAGADGDETRDAQGDAPSKAKNAVTAKLRGKPGKGTKADGDARPKRLSALDAAAQVLRAGGQALRCTELIAAMAEQGLWTSPNGKTPSATLYSAILREVANKGKASRFQKIERGKFEYNAAAG